MDTVCASRATLVLLLPVAISDGFIERIFRDLVQLEVSNLYRLLAFIVCYCAIVD